MLGAHSKLLLLVLLILSIGWVLDRVDCTFCCLDHPDLLGNREHHLPPGCLVWVFVLTPLGSPSHFLYINSFSNSHGGSFCAPKLKAFSSVYSSFLAKCQVIKFTWQEKRISSHFVVKSLCLIQQSQCFQWKLKITFATDTQSVSTLQLSGTFPFFHQRRK